MLSEVVEAIRRGSCFLIEKQDCDGFWRDFALTPGPSSTWVTACVSLALIDAESPSAAQTRAVAAAVEAARAIYTSSGWGYNQGVAADADTTAWVVRWFRRIGAVLPIDPLSCLQAYIGPGGGVRTFLNQPKYGNWAVEHVDVTPLVGLALAEAGAPAALTERLRSWILARRNSAGTWNSFWWTFDAYATARNVEFLARSGGLPTDVRADVQRFLYARQSPTSAIEEAHLLLAHVLVASAVQEAEPLVQRLLARQLGQGGWPPSRVLKVPGQRPGQSGEGVFEDGQGLMSTAMVLMALKMYAAARSTG